MGAVGKALVGFALLLAVGAAVGAAFLGLPGLTGGPADPADGGPTDGDGAPAGGNGGEDPRTADERRDLGTVAYSVAHAEAVRRNYTAVAGEAFTFWEAADRNPEDRTFVYTPDAGEADLKLRFVGRITECRGEATDGTYHFCSRSGNRTVRVAGVYEPAEMREILRYLGGQYAGHENPGRFEGVTDLSTARLPYIDPWPTEEPITVNLSVEVEGDRDWARLVREGVDYWQANQERYGNYTQGFEFRPNASEAAVTVSIVEEISRCGVENHTVDALGCADRYNRSLLARDTVSVRIEAGWDDRTTVRTVEHEFGHVYGRDHGQEPMPLMEPRYDNATRAGNGTLLGD